MKAIVIALFVMGLAMGVSIGLIIGDLPQLGGM
jgi:hypothetical protein